MLGVVADVSNQSLAFEFTSTEACARSWPMFATASWKVVLNLLACCSAPCHDAIGAHVRCAHEAVKALGHTLIIRAGLVLRFSIWEGHVDWLGGIAADGKGIGTKKPSKAADAADKNKLGAHDAALLSYFVNEWGGFVGKSSV